MVRFELANSGGLSSSFVLSRLLLFVLIYVYERGLVISYFCLVSLVRLCTYLVLGFGSERERENILST